MLQEPCVESQDDNSVVTPSDCSPVVGTFNDDRSCVPIVPGPSVTPSATRPKRAAPPCRAPSKKRAPRALSFTPDKHKSDAPARPDSGSETDCSYSDGETEWHRIPAEPELRLVSRKLRDSIVLHEERQLDALANGAYLSEWEKSSYGEEPPGVPDMDQADERPTRPDANGSGPGSSDTYTWSKDFSTFTGRPEVYLNTPSSRVTERSPLDLFLAVWDNEFIARIVKETNEYASQTIRKFKADSVHKNVPKWENTTVEEIYRLLALLDYMSIDYRSRMDEYWTTGVLGMPQFRAIMSRNRFVELMRFLHFVDNESIPATTSYERKISKITPVVEHCNRKFSNMYTPEQSLSLDESLLLWKGRLSWVQCIRPKAARFGIKTFELCEAKSGYLLRSMLYAGKNSRMVEGAIDGFENPTTKLVLELMDGFLDVGHMLVMDNWYNQLPLTRYLKRRHTDVIGTMNRRRMNVPLGIKCAAEKRMQRGEQISYHCGDIAMIAWKDCKLVTAISTCHTADRVLAIRAGLPFEKPVLIDCYNRNMGGVDLKDQKLSLFMFERKRGNKWYIKVFRRLLNTSFLNTYIIYSKHADCPLSHRDFRYKVAESLLATFMPIQIKIPIDRKVKVCEFMSPVPVRLIRDEKHDHFPKVTELTSGNAKRHKRRRCTCCTQRGKRTTSTLECRTCGVPLCLECWVDYHTLPTLKAPRRRDAPL